MTADNGHDHPHRVIRASAGTGKTHALSSRYLRLLRQGVPAEQVLATTFTRKAAGEIQARVLARLARGALDAGSARQLARDLGDDGLTLADTRAMLAALCRSLHRLCIGTLDSFFNRVAGSFRHELGIPPQPRLCAEDDPAAEQVRALAVEAMLADEDPFVVLDLLRRLHHDSTQRSVTEAIDDIVRALYGVHRQSSTEAWGRLVVPPGLLEPPALAEAAASLRDVATDDPLDRWGKQLGRGIANFRAAVEAHDWCNVACATIAAGTYHRKPVPAKVMAVILPLCGHARAAALDTLRKQTLATRELLERFDAHYTRLRQAHRLLLFSDLAHKLAHELPLMDAALTTELYYRLDSRVGHVMLDEFQDTSMAQWKVLRPLAQEITAHGDGSRTFFCVGDVKQAIYGWRGGCSEIFDQLEQDLLLPEVARQSLNTSYRASQAVLDAVNTVFTGLSRCSAFDKDDTHRGVARAWEQRFESHDSVHSDRPGYVELITSPAPSDEDVLDARSREGDGDGNGDGDDTGDAAAPGSDTHERFVAERIAELAHSCPGMSVGVLVRRNMKVNRLIFLLRGLNVDASGEGGATLEGDPAIAAVLSALLLADHPSHTAAAFHVLNSPMKDVVGLESIEEEHVAAVAARLRKELLVEGYAGLLTRWARGLAPSCHEGNALRLAQLIELADAYEPSLTLRPRDFVRFVESTPVEEPSPARVRVMTVHRAKGLEFDIVVLPELEPRLLGRADVPVYTLRPTPTSDIEAVFRATNQKTRALSPQLQDAYNQVASARLGDDLCSLYVAMTRPRFALHMIVPPLKPTAKGFGTAGWTNLSLATVVRQQLSTVGKDENLAGNEVIYRHGDEHWHEKVVGQVRRPEAVHEPEAPKRITLKKNETAAGRSWPVVTPSSLEDGAKVTVEDLVGADLSPARVRGTLIHKWFETIGWLDEGAAPAREELVAIAQEVAPTLDDQTLARYVEQFTAMLARPGVVGALSRPSGAEMAGVATLELWRERNFAVAQDGRLLQGQFDRVVVFRDASGAAVRAKLVDFKTDSVAEGGANVPQIVARYRPQMQAYAGALTRMLNLPEAKIERGLLLVAAGQWVGVD